MRPKARLGDVAVDGTVRNSVCGRSVERQGQVKVLAKRLPNCALAMAHSRGGMVHAFSVLFKTKYRALNVGSARQGDGRLWVMGDY
jgi:hypothetical protein